MMSLRAQETHHTHTHTLTSETGFTYALFYDVYSMDAVNERGTGGGRSCEMIGRCVLAQQAHEAVGGVGVEPEGRSYDVGGGMSPVLMIVMHAAQR